MNSMKSGPYLYSSLIPYAMTISGSSFMTAIAAAFMRSSARRSLGFSKAYLFENLISISKDCGESEWTAILVETSTVDADYDPGVWDEEVWLLETLHVFVSGVISLVFSQ